MAKKHFFMKLNPPRASFTIDMMEAERNIMLQHIAYWKPYVDNGTMIVMGPVADPKGGYGVGVIAVDDETQLHELIANDPANGLNSYEILPMMAASYRT